MKRSTSIVLTVIGTGVVALTFCQPRDCTPQDLSGAACRARGGGGGYGGGGGSLASTSRGGFGGAGEGHGGGGGGE